MNMTYKVIAILAILISIACTDKKSHTNSLKSETTVQRKETIETINIKNKSFLLTIEYQKLAACKWFKKDSSIVNDEFDEWLESTFYFPKNLNDCKIIRFSAYKNSL